MSQSHAAHIAALLRAAHGPVFKADASQVRVLRSPAEFLDTLRAGIAGARSRIRLSSLYLGADAPCRQLTADLDEALGAHPRLQASILLDCLRGSRGPGTSRATLMPLLARRHDRVAVSLYHTPELSGFVRKVLPARWNETIGLQHMKVYLFDDDVLLSGANLSDHYFGQRQDRYILFRGHRGLADYFTQLVDCVSSFSYRLEQAAGTAEGRLVMPEGAPDPVRSPRAFRQHASAALHSLLDKALAASSIQVDEAAASADAASAAWIVPLVQAGQLGVRQDEAATSAILAGHADPLLRGHIHLSSGYFNLTERYARLILASPHEIDILTASPRANGFFGSAGASGLIPAAYTYLERRFLERVRAAGAQERLRVVEYERPGWTFHAKGMWFTPAGAAASEPPIMTTVGSPNYGARSVDRDIEAQVMLCTQAPSLRGQLAAERRALYEHATAVTLETLARPDRVSSTTVRVVTPIIQDYF